MLDEEGVEYSYRDYRKELLSAEEIRALLRALGVRPRDVLRLRDRANAQLGLTGNEPDAEIITHMAEHPTLLQRPIGVVGSKAVVGRPPERLLELVYPASLRK